MALLVTAVERTTRKPDIAASRPVSNATCFTQGGFSTFGSLLASLRELTFVTSDLRFFLSAIDAPACFSQSAHEAPVVDAPSQAVGVCGWRPQRDSNPRYRRERAMSWASRRWGRAASSNGPHRIKQPSPRVECPLDGGASPRHTPPRC